jgi:class 3 adenylate cyclase/CheY-like chemotaxis protein
VRQELSAPATAIMGYAEMLMDDAVQAGRVQFTDDLQRILDAGRTLHRLILSLLDPATMHRADDNSDLAEFRRTLRHDLRTPINAIKGYGEMLREDAAGGSTETFIADLDKLLKEATLFLDRIDGLVTFSGGDAPPPEVAARTADGTGSPASIVESLIEAVRPVAANEADLRTVIPSRILVVDDNASNRDLLSRRLQRQGHTVLEAEDGARALALVEKEALDLVLLDLMMPGISGYDVLARLKRDPRHRDIPIIMISALSELDSIVRCIEAGADDYLAKPFDPTLLRARVGASLERKRLHDQVVAQAADLARQAADLAAWNKTLEQRVADQLGEIERMNGLKRFLSPKVAELILSTGNENALESHRRDVTVVFCDLRGFTAFTETAEPEEVMGVLRDYHGCLGELIHEFEGTVERFAGDGILIMFNDPIPIPEPSLRAVSMAVKMRERVAELSVKWRKAGHELGFGMGIARGYATLGRIGFQGRYDYAAIGTVTNLAARLCAEARSGQILIDSKVQGSVEGAIGTEPASELTLKGFHRPIRAFNVSALQA